MMSSSSFRACGLSLALAGAIVALSACGDQAAPVVSSTVEPTPSEILEPEQVLEAFAWVSVDYTPVDYLAELASRAQVVARGTVLDVVPGRIQGGLTEAAAFAVRNSAVQVEVEEVRQGRVRPGDIIWVELPVQPGELETGVIPGQGVALFIDPAPRSTKSYPRGTDGSQIPAGAPIWAPAHPEGLVLQYGETSGTVTPFAGEVDPNNTAAETLDY